MSLVKCPKCGCEISEKAKKCIHCGTILVEIPQKIRICPECGKEILEDVVECPFCGCPFEEEMLLETNNIDISKKKRKKIITVIMAIMVISIVGLIVYSIRIIIPQKKYDKAIELLEKGKYDEAEELLESIQRYKDVEMIREQLRYESYAYSAISNLKKYLKNPDSYQPYEITFYSSMDTKNSSNSEEVQTVEEEQYPICIMRYGAQNGFGGNTIGYSIFSYNANAKEYELLGHCDSLDVDDYDGDEEDDAFDLMTCYIINMYRDKGNTIGSIDLVRLKTVLKNETYSTIKIIE